MRGEVTTRRIRSGKHSHFWIASCTDTLYSLFVCPNCGRVNMIRLNAAFSARERAEQDALNQLDRVWQETAEKLKTPGPKAGQLFITARFRCKCEYCQKEPVWVSAIRKGEVNEGLLALVSGLTTFAALIGGVWAVLSPLTSTGNEYKWLGALLIILVTVVVLQGYAFFATRGYNRVWERIAGIIGDGISEHPPLFGDSIEDVKQQARASEMYSHISFDDAKWTYP